jgi:hypothetical protein
MKFKTENMVQINRLMEIKQEIIRLKIVYCQLRISKMLCKLMKCLDSSIQSN